MVHLRLEVPDFALEPSHPPIHFPRLWQSHRRHPGWRRWAEFVLEECVVRVLLIRRPPRPERLLGWVECSVRVLDPELWLRVLLALRHVFLRLSLRVGSWGLQLYRICLLYTSPSPRDS
eukprot:TRINITY_DN1089_c0_g1_i2.p1 TRINITY_DN1089_c0_g1~~TRINITY_DN1089_c0_g1_i2.p1  ORF type:complete len:119 (-),score=8.84 TRINITY_DN1089_c0_g1_i2:120-476(-)